MSLNHDGEFFYHVGNKEQAKFMQINPGFTTIIQ